MFMRRETGIPLDEKRRIVAYRDSLQAKVNALRERTPSVPAYFAGRDTSPRGGRQEGVVFCAWVRVRVTLVTPEEMDIIDLLQLAKSSCSRRLERVCRSSNG